VFPLSEAMRNHAILKRNGVPVKMIWFCGGHGICLGGDGPGTVLEKAVVNWFDRYLKGKDVRTGPPFVFFPDAGKVTAGATFPPVRKGAISATGSGTLAITPSADAGGGALIASLPNATAFNLDFPPARAAADVLGEPRLRFTYSGTAAPAQTHVYAQIVDTARNLVLGNVSTPIPVTLDGRTRTIERPLEPVVARAAAGKRYRLQIASASTLYTIQRSSGLVNLSKVGITLPLIDAKAPPVLRLRVGPTRGMRRARRGRPFKVRVRALDDMLTGVRLIVRDQLNLRVGSSKPFTLKSKTRKPRIRVTRRLRPGRYRIIATGENAEGITVRTIKRLRIRKRR
jgi:ABC-2 type transport system ATP-binding protein